MPEPGDLISHWEIRMTRSAAASKHVDIEMAAASWADRYEGEIQDLGLTVGRIRSDRARELEDKMVERCGLEIFHLHALIAVASRLNENCSRKWRKSRREGNRVDVLLELHAQALLVGDEILALVRSGFVAAAEVRWRTLYELRVYAGFIARHSDGFARRYKCDHIAEQHRRFKRGDLDSYEEEMPGEVRKLKAEVAREYARVERIYGPSIGKPYGWALPAFSGKRVTFKDLAVHVLGEDLPGWSRYTNASHHVHGERMSSMKLLQVERSRIGPRFAPRSGSTWPILYEVADELSDITAMLAGLVFAVDGVDAAYYMSYLCGRLPWMCRQRLSGVGVRSTLAT